MAKSLSERIAARSVKKSPSRSAQNRAAFLALRADIKLALEDGWPVKSIWETLNEEGKIDFSYQAFRGYTNRLILAPPVQKPAESVPGASDAKAPNPQTVTAPQHAAPKTADKRPANLAGFTFNPVPNKEDLL